MKEPQQSEKKRGKQGGKPVPEEFPDHILDALLRAAYGRKSTTHRPGDPQEPQRGPTGHKSFNSGED